MTSPRPACSVDQVKKIPGGDFDTGKSGVCGAAIQRASDRIADLLFLMTPDEPSSLAHLPTCAPGEAPPILCAALKGAAKAALYCAHRAIYMAPQSLLVSSRDGA